MQESSGARSPQVERVPRPDRCHLGWEGLVAGVGLGEGGLGWSVDSAGPTVTAAWPTWVRE